MRIIEEINAFGHKNLLCTHGTTIEITKDSFLSKRGNCILGVNSSKACIDLTAELKEIIKNGKRLKITIKVDNLKDSFCGYGNKKLTLSNKKEMVFRKSNFICDRTVLINCNKSSNDLNRQIINLLTNPEMEMKIIFELDDSYD